MVNFIHSHKMSSNTILCKKGLGNRLIFKRTLSWGERGVEVASL